MTQALRCAALASGIAFAMQAMPAAALGPQTLLDPLKAFRLTLVAVDATSAQIEFRIAEGYYLYRDRFRFEIPDGRVLAEVELPRGKAKQDPFFGPTEIYRDRVSIRVPLGGAERARGSVRLKVVSQGCSDSGVCYIPQEQWVEVGLGAESEGMRR
ncbi:MAG TPA: protein-disulfide reductase DsbD N-terminal domain-containing protein [Burkholderiales bacterium]|nr:protein-disulfide reductase DsbD N-terminal domain-containing protein [Burkholderiales bacterium]